MKQMMWQRISEALRIALRYILVLAVCIPCAWNVARAAGVNLKPVQEGIGGTGNIETGVSELDIPEVPELPERGIPDMPDVDVPTDVPDFNVPADLPDVDDTDVETP